MVSGEEPSQSRLDEWFLPGCHQTLRQRYSPPPPSLPLLPRSARRAHKILACRATSALAGCAYSAAGQAASALHSMAVLQVFQAKACLDQLWRAFLNASRRLRSHLKRCDSSSLNAPAPLLLPVTLNLCRLSRQPNQHQPPRSPDPLRVGEIEGAHGQEDATTFRSAKDPGPRSSSSPAYGELLDVMTHATTWLSLDWPPETCSQQSSE